LPKNAPAPNRVLILGSGPDARDAAAWPSENFTHIVAINNAWQVRGDWDYLIHPEDFPKDRLPKIRNAQKQKEITANNYVPVQNRYGGFVYAGGTMAFTAGYWALGALKPDVMAFFGCDMNYDERNGNTHFYGNGTADPLRDDVTLRNLSAKSARLMAIAADEDCLTVNLSEQEQSRLVFPRASLDELESWRREDIKLMLATQNTHRRQTEMDEALNAEAELGYMVLSGRYWEEAGRFDEAALKRVDDQWLKAL
jgi:hypothetical protein